jgi:DNA-directed RNA polymerase specialized sigma24 family protein
LLVAPDRARLGTHQPDLETLAQAYWRPVHAWLRLNLRGGAEDAADVAQDFFVWMMQSDFLARADPARGRFRAYLRTALRHFVIDRRRRERTQKHGGQRGIGRCTTPGASRSSCRRRSWSRMRRSMRRGARSWCSARPRCSSRSSRSRTRPSTSGSSTITT